MSDSAERELLARYLEEHNLKHTRQRDVILDAFLASKGHVTSEELYQRVREEHPNIGYTTVYRTMKLLADAGVAQERQFGDGLTRYEVEQEHHDHLVCLGCGRIVEFECEEIEAAQAEIAERYRFRLVRHRHELYGYCASCGSAR
ncbi:MAG: transcriptional repressor [Myxococcota bacterium]